MSSPVLCGAESTVVHTVLARPIVGALICVGVSVWGVSMTGDPDSFGGCGVTGGDLYRITEVTPQSSTVCAIPEEPPIAVSK